MIFNGIDRMMLGKIADAMTKLAMHVGEKIFRKGQVGDDFYNINAGKVRFTDISLGDAKYVDQILNLKDDGWATGRFDIEMGDNP